jgi:electron transport complex protein RnfD
MLGRETVYYQFQKPQINLARSTGARMWLVSACAFGAVLQSALTDSFASLFIALAATAAALAAELFIGFHSGRRSLKDSSAGTSAGSAVASALILTLLLPNNLPPLLAAAGALFAMVVIKHSFGGLGANWVNPAAGGWLFIRFSWPEYFRLSLEGAPLSFLHNYAFSSGAPVPPLLNPLQVLTANGFLNSNTDKLFTGFLNKAVLAVFGVHLPDGYLALFSQTSPAIIADRGILLLLAGSIVITAAQANQFWISAFYLAAYLFMVRLSGAMPFMGTIPGGDLIFTLLSGGTLATAFFLLADSATGPKTNIVRVFHVFAAAFLSWYFRFVKFEQYGAIFAVVVLNAIVPLLRLFENRYFYKKRSSL